MDTTAAPSHPATFRHLISLAWPVMLSRSTQAVIGFTDAAMVAHLGEEALAATTTGAINAMTLLILPMGTVFIVQSFAAQLTGAGDPAGARRYAWYGLMVALVTTALSVFAVRFTDDALGLFGYAPGVHALMSRYLEIRLLASGAVVGMEALANWYGGLGNTRLPMLANVVAMVLNVMLCWVLIYGNFGAPELGVIGSAWASALASLLAFLLLLVAFLARIAAPRVSGPLRLRLPELGRMLRFGLPTGLNWFLEFAAFSFFINVVVVDLGTTVVAAIMTVVQINSVSFMPAFGLASAGAIVVGQAIGARRHEDVPGTVLRTAALAAGWMGLTAIVYLVFPQPLMELFASKEVPSARLVEVGATVLALSAIWQLFDAATMTLSEALRAAGDTTWTLWARIVVAWVIFVPLSLLAVRVWNAGPVGAMLCLAFYLAALSSVLYLRFRAGVWRRIDLTGNAAVHA